MKYKGLRGFEIDGHLDIIVNHNEDEYEGVKEKWTEVLIHGDPEGLRSFAKLILEMAALDQEKVADKYLPYGAREHYLLRPGFELANSSVQTIFGRLDAKGSKTFYDRFIPKDSLSDLDNDQK